MTLWEFASRRRLGEHEHQLDITSLAFARDKRRLVAASSAGSWSSWLLPSGRPASRGVHPGGVTAAHLWSGDRYLVTSGCDGTARIWDVADGAELGCLRGHGGAVLCDVRPDYRELATAGDDRILHLWSIEFEWLLGAAALADALEAVRGRASRAWALPAGADLDALSLFDHALDVWRDIERARSLAARWPDAWRELRERVLSIALHAGAADPQGVQARIAATSLRGDLEPRLAR